MLRVFAGVVAWVGSSAGLTGLRRFDWGGFWIMRSCGAGLDGWRGAWWGGPDGVYWGLKVSMTIIGPPQFGQGWLRGGVGSWWVSVTG